MDEKLKNCPFCGADVIIERCVDEELQETELFYIQCNGCMIATDRYISADTVLEKWNRRVGDN